jgi:hypothetical protein
LRQPGNALPIAFASIGAIGALLNAGKTLNIFTISA